MLVAVTLCNARLAAATDFFVAPHGLPTNSGTSDQPLSLAKALSATSPAQPGDTIWLLGGVYSGTFTSVLEGTQQLPITVRQYPGERATLDGAGSNAPVLSAFGAWTLFWGFELTNSDPQRFASLPGSFPDDLGRGLGINAIGSHLKFINLVFHNLAGGIGVWENTPGDSLDTEIYGSLFYYNGWQGPDRQHGHGIYTQNRTGQRPLRENILFSQFSHGIHAYGSESAFVDNLTLEGNVAFNNGILGIEGLQRDIIVSGGVEVLNPVLHQNYTFGGTHTLINGGLGCTNGVVTDNYFVGRDPFILDSCSPVMTGNTLYGYFDAVLDYGSLPDLFPQNTYHRQRPTANVIAVRPNVYEPGRGHVIVYNWAGHGSVAVDLTPLGLSIGAAYEIRDAQNFFGSPVAAGVYDGSPVMLPMAGLTPEVPIGNVPVVPDHTAPEFGVFVVLPSEDGLIIEPPLVVATPTINPAGKNVLRFRARRDDHDHTRRRNSLHHGRKRADERVNAVYGTVPHLAKQHGEGAGVRAKHAVQCGCECQLYDHSAAGPDPDDQSPRRELQWACDSDAGAAGGSSLGRAASPIVPVERLQTRTGWSMARDSLCV